MRRATPAGLLESNGGELSQQEHIISFRKNRTASVTRHLSLTIHLPFTITLLRCPSRIAIYRSSSQVISRTSQKLTWRYKQFITVLGPSVPPSAHPSTPQRRRLVIFCMPLKKLTEIWNLQLLGLVFVHQRVSSLHVPHLIPGSCIEAW